MVARATAADVPEICVLQRCCWVSEAILNDTLDIPALHEDLDDIRAWVQTRLVWTVRRDGRLVGAVRAHQEGDRWEIGRLMVAPDLAGKGLGRWLLELAESHAPAQVRHFTLFTGARSERNQRMYTRAGYRLSTPPDGPGGHIKTAVFLTKAAAHT
ncbi:GNAT family N-acetyltransferase [Pseudonocardia sp. GCM10023141]|uniref:GNAT family N-acetyltransferase n=1 Tax=Pseudonocardia sp. GCM10023141 TaxID=3252653 RepID=UPI00361EDC0F